MELHVTLASAPPSAFPTREIVVDTDVLTTGEALTRQLEADGYIHPFTVDGLPLAELVPFGGALCDGAIIVSGKHQQPETAPRMPHLLFVVHSGPDAGQVFPLARGTYTIGRAASDIVVSDSALSRSHARLTVTEDAILLEDLQSANGTFVDGESISTAAITVSTAVRLGASRCRIELLDDGAWDDTAHAELLEALSVDQAVPRKPSRILILTALLPLVLGVALALTTGMWFFLAFSALSAVTGLVPLVTYRRNAHTFTSAVARTAVQDRSRRVHGVPDPGHIALDALRARPAVAPRPTRGRTSPDRVLLRLGTADQPANMTAQRSDEPFVPPLLLDVPLVLVCHARGEGTSERSFMITGEDGAARSLVRALLLQVSQPYIDTPLVVLWGHAHEVPLQARFLPNVRLTMDARILTSILTRSGVTVVFQFSDGLPDLSDTAGVLVIRISTGRRTPAGSGPMIATTAGAGMVVHADNSARARIAGQEFEVTPDGVADGTFDRTVRALARAGARGGAPDRANPSPFSEDAPPSSASVWSVELAPDSLTESVSARWASSDPDHPSALVGDSGTGHVFIDLVDDGPHLLVAGTTGSGKSEFLRTLVLGLAMDQPPEHLALLLIDYKGGSGLGVLAGLPHCVGNLSDLSSESTARALVSLRAELRRREHLCAEHGAHDVVELRRVAPSSCPPRLVVVIDEFRMLGDEVPSAVPDLMKIAALGRSLGVHLVLATQRPQGAVTPDMRANITSSILLRVQTAMESQDLLGSGLAADIPIDLPGRAFLRRGAEAPVAFQVASCSELPPPRTTRGWQDITTYLGDDPALAVEGDPHTPSPEPYTPTRSSTVTANRTPVSPDSGLPAAASLSRERSGSTDEAATGRERVAQSVLQRATAALRGAADGVDSSDPFVPVLPPLAAVLPSAACRAFLPADPEPPVPSAVRRSAGAGTHAVALGVADYPEHQEQRLLQWRPQDHSHLALVGLPGCGSGASLASVISTLPVADPEVHLYLLDGDGSLERVPLGAHLGAYVASHETKRAGRVLERLTALPSVSTRDAPQIVLAISGWGRWVSQFRNLRSSRAEEDLYSLVRDGARRGVSVVITGDRELTTARFFPLMPNRIYLPLGAHQETIMTWPKIPSLDAVAGRGFAQGRITGSSGDGVCQLVLEAASAEAPERIPARLPFPVHPLPHSVPITRLLPAMTGAPAGDDVVLGVQGDDLRPYTIPLRAGETYLVLGHRSSGRSNALRVIAEAAQVLKRRDVLAPPPTAAGSGIAEYWRRLAEQYAATSTLDRCILVVDDADDLPGDVQQILSKFVARGAAAALSAVPGPTLMTRVPLSLQSRSSGRGFVLSPKSPSDGDIFGVRLDQDGTTIQGRGYACAPAGVLEVQIARATGNGEAGPGIHRPGAPSATAFLRSL
ncbi:FHA domain-containing protein [Arthrobacter sp. NamB2]|uniref:FtsK/SpoIIIE domain-containing protein n=1 Tax=Arthrobacter sp. NamB2 TaxID=2576035 RepID=UPI0010C9828F|nr:FtsK/SpoIIIE domain-containing protein [Arthrobacter sp. NamB2]TKV29700.1 FHA domain-containing protein [Arthrobacter sp. NamB2]